MEMPKSYMKLPPDERADIILMAKAVISNAEESQYPNIARATVDRDGKIELIFTYISKIYSNGKKSNEVLSEIEAELVED